MRVGGLIVRSAAAAIAAWWCLLSTAPALGQSRTITVEPAPKSDTASKGRVSSPLYGESWAVVVGINDYRNPRVPALRYAVQDADAVERALASQGFRKDRIVKLVNAQATKAAIEQVLGDDLRSKVGPNDRVLVFFAGHGKTDRLRNGELEGYLLPVDADPVRLFSTAISMSGLRQISERIPAKHLLFIVDACYSGYAVFARSISEQLLEEMIRKPAIQILTAGRQEDEAQERNGHGVFTEVLIRGLEGAAFGEHPWIALDELAVWVKQRVFAESNRKQLPQYGNLSGEGQFVFMRGDGQRERAPARPPTVVEEVQRSVGAVAVTSAIAGLEVWLDDVRIGETKPGRALVATDLPVGAHRLRAERAGYQPWERRVNVEMNHRTEVHIEPRALAAIPSPSAPGATRPSSPPPAAPNATARRFGKDDAVMVRVPAGSFLLGARADDPDASPAERPQREIELSAFWIDQFEVTNAQYRAFRDATGYRVPLYWHDSRFNGLRQPVVGVSWDDAQSYCRWAGKRLPTEAEWEKAARGSDGRAFPWGNEPLTDRAQAFANGTADVGTYPMGASPYGAMDMAGNVWEWVHDWFDAKSYERLALLKDPAGPTVGGEKVLRGGSWWDRDAKALRTTSRHRQPPDKRNNNVGFRCGKGD